MDRDQAKGIVKKVMAFFPSWKVDEETAKIWIDTLESESYENVESNLDVYVRQGKEFAPSISLLMKDNHLKRDPELVARDIEIARNQWINEGNDPSEFEPGHASNR